MVGFGYDPLYGQLQRLDVHGCSGFCLCNRVVRHSLLCHMVGFLLCRFAADGGEMAANAFHLSGRIHLYAVQYHDPTISELGDSDELHAFRRRAACIDVQIDCSGDGIGYHHRHPGYRHCHPPLYLLGRALGRLDHRCGSGRNPSQHHIHHHASRPAACWRCGEPDQSSSGTFI